MYSTNTNKQIHQIEEEIASLPSGNLSKKTIKGNDYYYYRWTENKKRYEKFVSSQNLENLRYQIEKRKTLEQELASLKKRLTNINSDTVYGYDTHILYGEDLRTFSSSVINFKKRECFDQLNDYVYGDNNDKVLILYGLRRTGKTTLIRQIFAEMNDPVLAKSAFIQITSKDTLASVNHDLKILESRGFRYVFFDEVTLMDDFIEGSALFSDIFAASGMKIVLSGTDSLGFLFAEDEQLYDRCILLHTTFIPYREFESVLRITGIDEFIRYGGTMSLSGTHYNEASIFATKESADEYVDTAIARNIQHSLKCYQHGDHFRHLQDLYKKNELTSAINRVVEDINHRFTLEVLTQKWKSHDLGISASNLRKDRFRPTDILDRIDIDSVTENLRNLLEIRNEGERDIELDDIHVTEIKEYLELLDLVAFIDVEYLPNVAEKSNRTVISQPGLRYAQADSLIRSMLLDQTFSNLSLPERRAVQKRILAEIKGRMLEDIVLLETSLANRDKQVFMLKFPIGEFDMVVFDEISGNCKIYEIKYSNEISPQQYRHLKDFEKCKQTEHRYGYITEKTVLYRGKSCKVDDIQYLNVEEYLRGLKK